MHYGEKAGCWSYSLKRRTYRNASCKAHSTLTATRGKVAAALKWVSGSRGGVIKALHEKHPEKSEAPVTILEQLVTSPPPSIDPIIFEDIDETSIDKAAKTTKGSAGPSDMDSDMWRRIFCSKAYGSASEDLRYSIALLTRKLCTEFVDPNALKELLACRLIPLDKNSGIRPIGIGEVLRRIIGKAVTSHLKPEVIGAGGPRQLPACHDGGSEAAVHAMRQAFKETSCEAFLLADASNAFNCLHRTEPLLQVQYICPEFATYLINTYRIPCKLFLPGGSFLLSKEGTTHGDNAASGFYCLGVTPLVKALAPTVSKSGMQMMRELQGTWKA